MKDLKKKLIEAIESLIHAKNISAENNTISFTYKGENVTMTLIDDTTIDLTISGQTETIKVEEYAEEVVWDRLVA